MAERKPRRGSMVVTKMGGEYHVLFQPDDLPHHYLSVARFQDRGRAVTYAEIEGLWVGDEGACQVDALGLSPIADPKAPVSPVSPAEPVEAILLQPEETAPTATPAQSAARTALSKPAAPAAKTETRPLPPVMAEAKDRALDHYAEHGGSQAEVAAHTGVALGSLSGFMAAARKDGDPRIAAGDAKRAMTPQLARLIAAPTSAEPTKSPEAPPAPSSTSKPRTHAEIVAAARQAVPAPTFSRHGGATVRTG